MRLDGIAIVGQLAVAAVEGVLWLHDQQIRTCALDSSARTSRVTLQLDGRGRVTSATVDSGDRRVDQCLHALLETLIFDAPANGAPASVTLTVSLNP